MMSRLLSVFFVLAVLAGCKSSECTKEETPSDIVEQVKGVEDRELYWYQRGVDATRAIWDKYRLSDDVALLADGKGGDAPSFGFSTQVFSLLLDNVSTFWRKDLAAEAVAAYFGDFSSVYPDRSANGRNDEVLKWAIVCVRASRTTGDQRYLDEARNLYDSLWLNQVDNALGGGMWHRSDEKTSKSASANFCAVVAALGLYHATQDVKYLLQGRKLYKWTAERMFDPATGAVREGLSADGIRSDAESAENIGFFVGASMRLYRATGSTIYLVNAKKAADRLIGLSSSVRCAGSSAEGLSNGVAMRYLSELARRPGCEKYRDYILANARSAWTSRRLSDGLNGPDWTKPPLGGETIDPHNAVSAAILYMSASRACR